MVHNDARGATAAITGDTRRLRELHVCNFATSPSPRCGATAATTAALRPSATVAPHNECAGVVVQPAVLGAVPDRVERIDERLLQRAHGHLDAAVDEWPTARVVLPLRHERREAVAAGLEVCRVGWAADLQSGSGSAELGTSQNPGEASKATARPRAANTHIERQRGVRRVDWEVRQARDARLAAVERVLDVVGEDLDDGRALAHEGAVDEARAVHAEEDAVVVVQADLQG